MVLQIAWHKGNALTHLLKALNLDDQEDVLPIYIGDDKTDEDAFEVLMQRNPRGIGILVSSIVRTHPLAPFFGSAEFRVKCRVGGAN